MSDVFFTTNPADFTKLEGLYINEKNPPGFIRGRDLSRVGLAGLCVRGPTDVQLISSVGRFIEVYGGRDFGGGGDIAGEVWKALLNKPFGTVAVRRVVADDAATATLTVEDGVGGAGTKIAKISASSPGSWGNDVEVRVEDATDGDATHWNLRVRYLGVETLYENLDTSASTDNLAEVIGDDPATLILVEKLADGRPANFSTITETDWESKDTSDNYMALGTTLTAYDSDAGDEGTLAATDYTNGLADLVAFEDVSVVLVPESLEDTVTAGAQATLNGAIVTAAGTVHDRVFVTWSGETDNDASADIALLEAQITTRSDRIIWCYNPTYTVDPDTGTKVVQGPHVWMASILSQNDVDVHPGSQQTARQTAGIAKLEQQSIARGDLILLREAGISTLERLHGQFLFRSGVTTDLTSGKTEITRRRMADFLQLSAADRLRFFVKEKNIIETRAQMSGELVAFSQSLKDQSRIIEDFAVESETVNTPSSRAQGIEKLFWKVRLIGHVLFLVLETEIGTGVVVESGLA